MLKKFLAMLSLFLAHSGYANPTASAEKLEQGSPTVSRILQSPSGERIEIVSELNGSEILSLLAGKSYRVNSVYYAGGSIEVFYRFYADGKAITTFFQRQYGNDTETTRYSWKIVGNKIELQSSHQRHPITYSVGMSSNGKFAFIKQDNTVWFVQK